MPNAATNSILDTLAGYADKAVNIYGKFQANKNPTTENPKVTSNAGAAKTAADAAAPFYRQPWFAPVALGVGVLLALVLVLRRK